MEKYKVYITNVTRKVSRNDTPFLILDVNIADTSKNADGIFVWDNVEETYEVLEKGMTGLIGVDGMEKEYTKMLSFDEQELPPEIFVNTFFDSKEKAREVFDYMLDLANQDEKIKKLNDKLWTPELIEDFIWAPGAKHHHHAIAQGLVHHTYEVFQYAKGILETNYFGDELNTSVVYESILLHDLGKIFDYRIDEYGAIHTTKMSEWDSHLRKAASMVETAVGSNSDEKYKHIIHCILSHHNNLDWGAVVEPKTMEAKLVHQADSFSAIYNKYQLAEFDEDGCGKTTDFIKFGG